MDELPIEQIVGVTQSYGVTRVRVFGSRAGGTHCQTPISI